MNGRSPIVWEPQPDPAASALGRYMSWVGSELGRTFADYAELWSWSVAEPERFWESMWRYFEVQSTTPYDAVLSQRAMPGARWFVGASLNYADHALRHGPDDRVAMIAVREDGSRQELTWAELRGAVGGMGHALRERGIGPGDVVAAYLPNGVEAVIAYLACISVGAIWASCSPETAPPGALERFAQLRPALLIAGDGYRYAGRVYDRRAAVSEIAGALSELRAVVLVPHLGLGELAGPVHAEPWASWTAEPRPPTFTSVAFDAPMCVLFSSGTSGPPKGIVHGHGGLLLEHLRHHALHVELGDGDRFMFTGTTGWMVWNWLVAGLLLGSTIVLYDGSPEHPERDELFAVAARERVTHLGTSAGYLTACMKVGCTPGQDHDLRPLRALLSTGSPLPPEAFHWVSDHVGRHVWPVSTSGGTDVCSAFVSGCALVPVRAGEIQCRCLGAAIDVFDADGRPVVNEIGELVLTAPLPSMPVAFWDDPSGERYRAAYFADFPGVWRHGDWAALTDDGAVVILGRSDSTLNRRGVRIGTAEIYAIVDGMPEIGDSLVLGIEEPDGGYWMPLFVTLADDATLTSALETKICDAIRAAASPRHVPDEVRQVPAIPRTLTGKKVEVPVKRILMGMDPAAALNASSVADSRALEHFVALARERQGR